MPNVNAFLAANMDLQIRQPMCSFFWQRRRTQ